MKNNASRNILAGIGLSLGLIFAPAALPSHAQTAAPAADGVTADFAKAVRGCTTDGYIYRLTYSVEIDQAGALTAYQNMVQPDQTSLLGVRGTAEFMQLLQAVRNSTDSAMQALVGPMIDEATAEIVTGPVFENLMAEARAQIAQNAQQRYGISVSIRTTPPREQGGRCPAANVTPASPEQPEPAAPPARPAGPQ